jgi:hypothetical protein
MTPPSRPDGPAAGPGRTPTLIRVANRPGNRVANRAPAAAPTNGPPRGAAASTALSPTGTGMSRRAARLPGAGTRAANRTSRRMNRGAGVPRQPARTEPITPSPRSATGAPVRRNRPASRTPSGAAARGRPAGRTDGRRRNRGNTTSSGDRNLSELTGSPAATRTPGSPARS